MLNRLTILQKLLVLSASFTLPILVSAYFTLTGIQAEIKFTETERTGARYLGALGDLMRHVAHYPGKSKEDWQRRTAAIWEALEGVAHQKIPGLSPDQTATDSGGGSSLGPNSLKALWSRTDLAGTPPASGETAVTHHEFIAAIETAIAAVADARYLALDPDLDTTSLIDLTVFDLPHLQAQLSALLANPRLRDPHGRLRFEEQAQLTAWSALIREGGAQVAKDAARALQANAHSSRVSPTISTTLPGAVQTFTIELEVLVLLLSELAKPDSPPKDRAALGLFGTRVSEEGFALWSTAVTEMEQLLSMRQDAQERRRWEAALATLAALAVSAGLVLLIIRDITRPLNLLMAAARRIATGDLTGSLDLARRDEIGTLGVTVSAMTKSLASLVGKVQGASVQMASTATELAAASRQQESLVSDLGGSTARVVTAVSQISATSQELARAMNRVKEATADSERIADAGRSGLVEMEGTMHRLLEATGAVSASLAAIHDQANTVSAVITTMTKVADQTNLLSLNASIEAERLGEQGRGVAVVAREVLRLADQTAVATLDIERMVVEMRATVSAGVSEVKAFTGEMRQGVQTSTEINRQLSQIISLIKELAPQFDSVNAGFQAQTLGARQIRDAVAELNEGARQAADSLKQFNEAAAHMRQAAQNLRTEVDGFRV